VEIHAVTPDRLDDLADLFESNATTRGCWCMWFINPAADVKAGWSNGGNRRAFEAAAVDADPPMGLLAYDEGVPVGWLSTGPRSRYQRAIGKRTRILKARDASEDDDVWLLPCFFVRVGHRRQGIPAALLAAAVEHATAHGAAAVEGFPIAEGNDVSADDYLGKERRFAECGFECVDRPSPRRVVMRRSLD
jgi:GNAT superfamily N-acetyltransferase